MGYYSQSVELHLRHEEGTKPPLVVVEIGSFNGGAARELWDEDPRLFEDGGVQFFAIEPHPQAFTVRMRKMLNCEKFRRRIWALNFGFDFANATVCFEEEHHRGSRGAVAGGAVAGGAAAVGEDRAAATGAALILSSNDNNMQSVSTPSSTSCAQPAYASRV